jgi:glycosyltransferase involved in cell wall biosynthesis
MEGLMTSIVIPAHNESRVIERCLTSILTDARPNEFEIVVVCNGCTDDTAERARGFGDRVRVIETPIGSKIHALNLGDQHVSRFPTCN